MERAHREIEDIGGGHRVGHWDRVKRERDIGRNSSDVVRERLGRDVTKRA